MSQPAVIKARGVKPKGIILRCYIHAVKNVKYCAMLLLPEILQSDYPGVIFLVITQQIHNFITLNVLHVGNTD